MRVLHAIWSRLATSARFFFFFFFALVHVIFLRSVPARGRVTGAHVVSPVWRACTGMHACRCRAAAHPCLLSSSGSCPVELERRAQRRSASEDFILRGGGEKHKQRFQHPRTVSLSDRSEDTIFLHSHKNTGQTGHRCDFPQRHCLIEISVLF